MPGQHEALALFEDRATAVVPGFRLGPQNQEAVTMLCQRLDGVPLAIELAAVRLRALSAEQILERLEDRFQLLTGGKRDGPPRHQTLHAAVEWSFELCSETERLLWARWVAGADGEPGRAAVLFGAVESLWQRIGRPLVAGEPLVAWSEQAKARVLGDLGSRAHETARLQGARMSQDDMLAYALGEKMTADATASAAGPQLTKREQEVAGLVAAGLSNKDIASRLVISQRTAEGHIEHILTKLGSSSRAQIAAWVAGHGRPGGGAVQ